CSFDLENINDMDNNIEIGVSGYVVVIDQNGRFLAHPDEQLIGTGAEDQAYFNALSKNGDKGLIDYTGDGESRVLGYVTNDKTDWLIGETSSAETFKQKANKILVPIAVTLLIVIVFAVIISYITTKRLII